MEFADLEKAFDRVLRKVLWSAIRVDGVSEWLVKVVQAMYVGARSRTHVNSSFSQEFEVKVRGVPEISIKSSAVHHSPESTLRRISCRMSLGNALCG